MASRLNDSLGYSFWQFTEVRPKGYLNLNCDINTGREIKFLQLINGA